MAKNEKPAAPLPAWARVNVKGVIEIDPDLAYPGFLVEMGEDPEKADQYAIECCFHFAKLHIQRAIGGTEFDPRKSGAPLQLKILGDDGRKDRWALQNFPKGRGIEAATQGKGARNRYQEIYGFVPQ